MMSWQYRVLYNKDDEMYYITEAYYDNPDDKLYGYIADGVQPVGETVEELRECIERMLGCFDRPTLTHATREDEDELSTSSD